MASRLYQLERLLKFFRFAFGVTPAELARSRANVDMSWLDDEYRKRSHGLEYQALQQALEHDEYLIRRQAVEALGQIRDSQAVKILSKAYSNEDIIVREKAIDELGKIGSLEATEALAYILFRGNRDDAFIIQKIISTLGKIRNSTAIRFLSAACTDKNRTIRQDAGLALGQIGSPEAIRALISVCVTQCHIARHWGLEALGKVTNPNVILDIMKELSEMDTPQSIDALSQSLMSQNPTLRRQAAYVLENNNDRQAEQVFIRILGSDDSAAKQRAIKALAKRESAQAISSIFAASWDPDHGVSWTALQCLFKKWKAKGFEEISKAFLSCDHNIHPNILSPAIPCHECPLKRHLDNNQS